MLSVAAVALGSLLPSNSALMQAVGSAGLSDKLEHFLAYALLAFLPTLHENLYLVLSTLCFGAALGIGLEFAQLLTATRSFEVADMAADLAGLAAGALLALPLRRFLAPGPQLAAPGA